MKDFCSCKDWLSLKKAHSTIFQWDPTYGWVLTWPELTDEEGYTQLHRYGVVIHYCPICGKRLKSLEETLNG